MSTGNGPSHLNEMLGTMNSPGLSSTSFTSIEKEIGDWWLSALESNILEAGAQERSLAIERGDYHQEVPAITVITDGGWSKRTHKHSYNALGGVAIIIGKETGKLLHIGVRNKYCFVCQTAKNKLTDPKQHDCFKNWDSDSQSMESDIIVDGFKQAEGKHGLRYMRIIGDGDSSVFAKIREEVPLWGRAVEKEECANHVCKCYRSNLEKLVTDNPLYKGKHNLTKKVRIQLVSAVRVRGKQKENKELSPNAAVLQLKHDIINSVHHIFGNHSKCSDFCKMTSANSSQTNIEVNETNTIDNDSNFMNIFDEQVQFWEDGTSAEDMEKSRYGSFDFQNVEQFIIQDVSLLLRRIAEKAERLIGNATTNIAESWMHIRSKFDGGKIHNLCQRASWHVRCYGGGLRMNYGPQWSPVVWRQSTATQPGSFFTKVFQRQEAKLAQSKEHQKKPQTKKNRFLKKIRSLKQSTTNKAKRAYGEKATEVCEDVTDSELVAKKQEFLTKHVLVSSTQIHQIQNSTLQQSTSGLWHLERTKRITASNFGKVFRRKPSIPVNKLVHSLLYSNFKGNRHTRNGLLQERSTIEEYKLKKAEENENVTVQESGLVIDHNHNFLAGSPDGIVYTANGEKGLIEIKNLIHNKPLNLFEAADKITSFCLQNRNGKLFLKENHDYYYQCQGLMNICGTDWIDFVVRTLNPYHLFVQRIPRNEQLWNMMLPKLKAFYDKAILPELACPRDGKSPGIREPGVWYTPPKALNNNSRRDAGKKRGQSNEPVSRKTRKKR
ncbi:uncharacterized protein LOC134237079 isoform X2 [Saccostrea cucullata]